LHTGFGVGPYLAVFHGQLAAAHRIATSQGDRITQDSFAVRCYIQERAGGALW
jgi:hypothetical protein